MNGETCLVKMSSVTKRPMSIYIPDDLREWLQNKARNEHRAFTAQAVYILEQARAAEVST